MPESTEIQPFVFPPTGQRVRSFMLDDESWFVARDACAILKHTNTSRALSFLDDDEKRTLRRSDALTGGYPFDDLRVHSVALVNESGLYNLIFRSNLPAAKDFRRWVTGEVLPALRRTGTYSLPTEPEPAAVPATVGALAALAHREHVAPMAGRVLAYERWNKSHKGMAAFVQLTIDLGLPGIEGAAVEVRALPGRDAAR